MAIVSSKRGLLAFALAAVAVLCAATAGARRSSRSRFRATTSRSISPARSRSTRTRARTSRFRRRPAPTASCAASKSRPTTSVERRLGGLRARQHHRRAARPADRRATFPAGEFRPVLARPRVEPHRGDHAQRRFRARPPGEPGRRRLPRHAQPRRGGHLHRRARVAEPAAGLSVGPRSLQGLGQLLHALPRYRDRHRRPAGAVPDHPVRGQGNLDVPGDRGALLGGARLYQRRLRLPQQGHRDLARQRADLARRHRSRRWLRPSSSSCSPISISIAGTGISATVRSSGSAACC